METKVYFEKEMFFFRIPPSPFSQRELHLSHQASLPSGTSGCSWLCYSAARVLVSQRSLCPKGLAGSVYAIELRL